MSQFLNTEKLNEWIPKLIDKTDRELVIIVPYIKTSDRLYDALIRANKRGVETIIVYREESLKKTEKEKLKAIDNLNLLHHPNVHAKCYLNEHYLILTSMNMYEYSQLHNREMGVIFSMEDRGSGSFNYASTDEAVIKDTTEEINIIINAASLEKESRETIEEGFEMEILKSDFEKEQEKCSTINKAFLNKKFTAIEEDNRVASFCKDYFEKIDIIITYRVEIVLNLSSSEKKKIFNAFYAGEQDRTYKYNNLKFYWNYPDGKLFFYSDGGEYEEDNPIPKYKNLKKGIDALVGDIRKHFK